MVADSAGVAIVRHGPLPSTPTCEVGPELARFGTAAGDSLNDLFGVMDATRLPTGHVAILNAGTHQVKVFEESGTFAYQFGRRGDGPGEFLFNLWSLDVEGDALVVGESRTWRYSRFALDGGFIDAVEPSPHQIERPEFFALLPDSTGFLLGMSGCCTPDQGFETQRIHILSYDRAGSLRDTVAVLPFTEQGYLDRDIRLVGGPIFAARGALGVLVDGRFIYAPGTEDRLDVYAPHARWSVRSDGRIRIRP